MLLHSQAPIQYLSLKEEKRKGKLLRITYNYTICRCRFRRRTVITLSICGSEPLTRVLSYRHLDRRQQQRGQDVGKQGNTNQPPKMPVEFAAMNENMTMLPSAKTEGIRALKDVDAQFKAFDTYPWQKDRNFMVRQINRYCVSLSLSPPRPIDNNNRRLCFSCAWHALHF